MNHYGLVHVPNNIYLWRIETLEKLIDIYGDSIKMVSPDLFDFKRIEWLDVDEMLKYVELEYNKFSENCAALMGDISNSFRASLQNSLQAYKSVSNGNKSLGLAMAGLAMQDASVRGWDGQAFGGEAQRTAAAVEGSGHEDAETSSWHCGNAEARTRDNGEQDRWEVGAYYLREVFKRINLASNEDERKQAMSLLSDLSGYSLSEQEFTDFINGKKQIEL